MDPRSIHAPLANLDTVSDLDRELARQVRDQIMSALGITTIDVADESIKSTLNDLDAIATGQVTSRQALRAFLDPDSPLPLIDSHAVRTFISMRRTIGDKVLVLAERPQEPKFGVEVL